MTKTLDNVLQDYDITNECRYKLMPHYQGGHVYLIQAEHKTCWYGVAMLAKGELSVWDDKGRYKVKFKGDELKIYRKGPMPY